MWMKSWSQNWGTPKIPPEMVDSFRLVFFLETHKFLPSYHDRIIPFNIPLTRSCPPASTLSYNKGGSWLWKLAPQEPPGPHVGSGKLGIHFFRINRIQLGFFLGSRVDVWEGLHFQNPHFSWRQKVGVNCPGKSKTDSSSCWACFVVNHCPGQVREKWQCTMQWL